MISDNFCLAWDHRQCTDCHRVSVRCLSKRGAAGASDAACQGSWGPGHGDKIPVLQTKIHIVFCEKMHRMFVCEWLSLVYIYIYISIYIYICIYMVVYLIATMISMMFRGIRWASPGFADLFVRQVTHGLMQGAISAPRSLHRRGWKNSRDIL